MDASDNGTRLGLGRQEMERQYIAAENIERRQLEVEIQADEDEERRRKREVRLNCNLWPPAWPFFWRTPSRELNMVTVFQFVSSTLATFATCTAGVQQATTAYPTAAPACLPV